MIEPQHIAMNAKLHGVTGEPHKEGAAGFYHTGGAWYAEGALRNRDFDDQIMIGFYHEDGGTTGEFSLNFGTFRHVTPGGRWMRLNVFTDGLNALLNMPTLLVALAKYDPRSSMPPVNNTTAIDCPTPQEIIDLLLSLGFQDRTDRKPR